ncbi:I78 family peptidase inhibitor [Tsuneonella sp. HG222]
MPRPVLPIAFVSLVLAACTAGETPADSPSPSPTATETASADDPAVVSEQAVGEAQQAPQPADADASQCEAEKVGEFVNAQPTAETKAAIADAVGDRPIRYYTQGDPITMDFNVARLNVELGADGRIKLFRCG